MPEMPKIVENNLLIAEFLAWSFEISEDKLTARLNGEVQWFDMPKYLFNAIEGFKFHSSWDALMPVVEKIESMSDKIIAKIWISILGHTCTMWNYYDPMEVLRKTDFGSTYKIKHTGISKIEATYKAVIAFIQWYNAQSKPPHP